MVKSLLSSPLPELEFSSFRIVVEKNWPWADGLHIAPPVYAIRVRSSCLGKTSDQWRVKLEVVFPRSSWINVIQDSCFRLSGSWLLNPKCSFYVHVSRTCRLCREPELTPSWLQVRASSAQHGHFDLYTIVRCCVPDCEKSPRTNRVTQVREGMEFLSLSFGQRGALEDMSKLDFVPGPEIRVCAGTAQPKESGSSGPTNRIKRPWRDTDKFAV